VPGRAYIGLSSHEKHPAEFRPARLPDASHVTVWLVVGAVPAALSVIILGYMVRWPATRPRGWHHGLCNAMPLDSPPFLPPHLT